MKKFFAAIITVVIAFLAMSVSASADGHEVSLVLQADGLHYGGNLTPLEASDPILGGGSYSWNSGILTITDVNFTTSAETALDLTYYSAPVTLNINGTNSFESTHNNIGSASGIDTHQRLTITGSGTVYATASGDSYTESNRGIIAETSTSEIIINSGTVIARGTTHGIDTPKITVNGGSLIATGIQNSGILIYNADSSVDDIVINGGTVQATGGCGISGQKIAINGGTVTATGMDNADGDSCGISGLNVTIGGTAVVEAKGGNVTNGDSYGIRIPTYIIADDFGVLIQTQLIRKIEVGGTAVVTAEGGSATGGTSSGIHFMTSAIPTSNAGSEFLINGGTLTATGGTADSSSYGIFADDGNVEISGGTVTANGGAADSSSYGIHTLNGDVIISDAAEVTANGGNSTSYNSYGITSYSISVTDTAQVNANGGEAGSSSFGISVLSAFNISGGNVTATGGASYNESHGIQTTYIYISGGNLTATGGTADVYSYGIYAGITFESSDGSVIATGGEAGNRSFGINAYDDIVISGGNLTATGGSANFFSFGIYTDGGDVEISGGNIKLSGETSAANTGSVTPFIAVVDADNADGSAAERVDETEIDLSLIKYIKTYENGVAFLRDYPRPIPQYEPEPAPVEAGYNAPAPPSPPTTVSENAPTAKAFLNESGSVNSYETVLSVAEAAKIAKAKGETTMILLVPEGAKGLSKTTIQKIIQAADGIEIVLDLKGVQDGETVGSISLPLTSVTGQILTDIRFDSKRTAQTEEYIKNRWGIEVLASFETAQQGGWGAEATITIPLEKFGFEVGDITELYALIYDTKKKKWYKAEIEIVNEEIVIKTERSGVFAIVADSSALIAAD
jgi:hypothetical protein